MASSPDRNGSLFHHQSWAEPWAHPEFPPEESPKDREKRFRQREWFMWLPSIIEQWAFRDRTWPWGYVVYRTTYSSQEDWHAALVKLDHYFWGGVIPPITRGHKPLLGQLDTYELVRAGYRNVIIEDPALDGVGVGVVFEKHRAWVAQHGFRPDNCPRFGYPLMVDEPCIRSILATTGPRGFEVSSGSWAGPYGYINILDVAEHDPEASDYDEGPFYDGCMRMELDALVRFVAQTEDYPLCEQYLGLTSIDQVLYTDGTRARIEARSMVTHRRRLNSSGFGYERQPYP
ncbi:uncharacterized protein BO97DRAFT_406716 [Aspergillus homomorphus CBS 101889]|uniref:Uncharacterized protein n=1 Tax=Aspergillus homomorphus (strain CBS 101889) TaxID=1450537 RepID=A0A395HT90_ASPHC|nr:hypothetical protein BO97DRAFT_406716 [Aspergillus homomorphus CBS 101889]RAL10709.1 hypothetical protein BO97DRAFT_406716 [Aspergillus homomorphus CBS 101889]